MMPNEQKKAVPGTSSIHSEKARMHAGIRHRKDVENAKSYVRTEHFYICLGWLVVLIGAFGSVLWAALAPLDKGVSIPGTVKVAGSSKVIQTALDGKVKRILTHNGAAVLSGQALVVLDDTELKATVASLQTQLASARTSAFRLSTEGASQDDMRPLRPTGVTADSGSEFTQLQRQLMDARQQALSRELEVLAELSAGYEAELAGLQGSHAARRQQEAGLREQVDGLRALADDGFVSRNRLIDSERLLAQTNAALAQDVGRIGQLQRQINEQGLRKKLKREQFQAEVQGQRAEYWLQVESLSERLRSAQYSLQNSVIRAAVDGIVVGMSVFTEGGYVRSGERLMSLVPAGRHNIIEAQLPVHLVDKIKKGLPVTIMLTALNQNVTPRITGIVSVVGADRLLDERSGNAYYNVEVDLTPASFASLRSQELRPGMPAEVFIRTGERSLLSYLFKPIRDRARSALSEE
ncbi:HlyD family type I secretion periplasmic adaptor subunit [Janthinobacterium lividum]|uniref:HlyD family type I secretion periplasmic adaptor subunit n=1 Tax=Janthinobacterium lividum TaxID=29581 RepID=UPI0008932BE4|nr:HlyD family type I secretion periplasmic adaptor subunit [Janthinobacterium lividum]MCC7716963.1 HlyD family type I secretion periplasmic adaptor subunit [Janthinobacterium lividum]OEZ53468.1 type I secretion system membrane fusion protein PrsE [Janthinobacterium lividum]WQE31911.1 HlyD family type I secretion periplasmic adaptor subunit [Janthinobacterium lividum]STS86181.1 Type I secretion system membrane fusion protein PrsE [Janthinobacterium lividum]